MTNRMTQQQWAKQIQEKRAEAASGVDFAYASDAERMAYFIDENGDMIEDPARYDEMGNVIGETKQFFVEGDPAITT